MSEKKPLMEENTSIKTWKTPTFHPKPTTSFLYPKEINGLVVPPLFRGCLAVEKEKRENPKARIVSFSKYLTECLQSLVWGVSYHQTHYKLPKDKNKALLHMEKVGKTKKIKKSKQKG